MRDPSSVGSGEATVPLDSARVVTGLIAKGEHASAVRQLATAARRTQNLPDALIDIPVEALPERPDWLDAFDQMVLAADELGDNPAGLTALRRWVTSGGKLWVIIDDVSDETLARLLGDDHQAAIVDHVDLHDVAIVDVRDVPRKIEAPQRQFEPSVNMARVLLGLHQHRAFDVDGWPAAYWQSVGRGRVLLTTVSPAVWIDSSPNTATPAVVGNLTPLAVLAAEFFQPRTRPPALSLALDGHAAAMVGYSTIGRNTIASVLFAWSGAAVFLTIGPAKALRRPSVLAGLTMLALATGAGLISVGARARQAIDPTMVAMQVAEADDARGEMKVQAIVGAYEPARGAELLNGRDVALADEGPWVANPQGVVWTDIGRWRLAAPLPAGLTLQPCTWHEDLPAPPLVDASLTSRGLQGELTASVVPQAENAILVAPGLPAVAVEIDAAGRWTAAIDARLEIDQFVAARMLDAPAQRRQTAYRNLLAPGATRPALRVDGPMLMFWTPPRTSPVSIGAGRRQVGACLMIAPVRVARPKTGGAVAIPAPLLPFTSVDSPDGSPASSAYSNLAGQWVDGLIAASRISLRFQIPPTALPMTVNRATWYVDVNAPGRKVDFSAWRGQTPASVAVVTSPAGRRVAIRLDDPTLLKLDAHGGLTLTIDVGPHPNEEEASLAKVGWNIERAWLEIHEATVDAASPPAASVVAEAAPRAARRPALTIR